MNNFKEKWYDEAVFYHIYPLGMTGAPKTNTDSEVVHRFKQINEWLPHLQQIGVTAVYIGPLFESTTHGYDTKDYRLVDRRLGDNNDFKKFVKLAHDKNIKVVVDGVFNHTGREFFAFQDILKNRQNSKYCSWYKGVSFDWSSPYNDGVGYEAWRNCYELVNLNPWEPQVREYLLDTIEFWIDEFDIDGIRLDCADCLEDFFIEEMRSRTMQKKDDFWLMGEVIHGNYGSYIADNKLNSVTDYQLHKGLYSGHNDHNYFEIAHTIRYLFGIGGQCPGTHLYTFVDNHDVDRLASKVNIPEHMKLIYTLMYTLPGIPSIYYGSEWGIKGKKEGSNDDGMRPALNVHEMSQSNECPWLTEWIAVLGNVHKRHAACLAYGTYDELLLTNRQFAYARWINEEGIITAVNNDENEAQIWIPVRGADGIDTSKLVMDSIYDAVNGDKINLENGHIHLSLKPNESRIFVVGKTEYSVSENIINTDLVNNDDGIVVSFNDRIIDQVESCEIKMWDSAKARDSKAFLDLVDDNARMICGGYSCTGSEYAEIISKFDCTCYEITDYEKIVETDDLCQVHYVVKTECNSVENKDLAGEFHIVSTWKKKDGNWKLIFNMDSRIK